MPRGTNLNAMELETRNSPTGHVADGSCRIPTTSASTPEYGSPLAAPPRPEFSLPPADSGKDAWLFLAACWAVEALVWGFGFSFGVFQDYYTTHLPFKGTGNIAVVGTTTLGVMYMATPVVLILARFRPRWARWFTLGGLTSAAVVMALSSFSTTAGALVATQGVLFGLAGCVAYCPCILYIDEWFVRRKGMAYGITWSAAGFGGVVLPLLLETLLAQFGFQTALRAWACALFVLGVPISVYVKPRIPVPAATQVRNPLRNVRQSLLSRRFLLYQVANVVQATGYFLPAVYLPTYARSMFGASTLLAALTVLLVNVAATVGSVAMGWMSDKVPATTCLVVSGAGAAVATLVLWGLTSSLAGLYAFCVVYGLFAGCYTSIWPGIMRELASRSSGRQDEEGAEDAGGPQYTDPTLIFGWLCVGRGAGNVISGPLSDVLISGQPWAGGVVGGYGSGYGALIVYTGVSAVLGGSAYVWKRLGLL
ncbi:major facilitator superfamily domain-containing protein [Microdochium trichocladiopsis]|uniref:Major facilitator superfamily domain-containing protein n=1 Tax=Microdochium trichocladiopsis TaxID=1682393 RepID=A0A9P9BLQ9_9PEZI|nr:major facilitator superfamily domain-containing protein [Microdochium trichocladiopsis]KAH7014342.1 major facilitator superfamily domain-containing protein [Microdochium trichocladiopsis]